MTAAVQGEMDVKVLETLSGEVVGITFRNEESGFSILRIEAKGHRDPVTVVGSSLSNVGELVEVKGSWKVHPTYGRQLEAQSITPHRPTSAAGIERYLASGIITGVGPAIAARIVAEFGEDTFNVLDETPEAVLKIKGVGKKLAENIARSWNESQAERKVLVFLASHGIMGAVATRIMRAYEGAAIEVVEREPYRMAKEIRGIGFATADEIAMKMGIAPTDPARIEAGLRHVVTTSTGMGHCGVPLERFLTIACKALSLPRHVVEPVMNEQLNTREFMVPVLLDGDGRYVFDKRLYDAEARISREIARMDTAPPWSVNREQAEEIAIEAAQACGVELAPEQHQAVVMALLARVSVLTGGPGTGKTSTLKVILTALKQVRAKVLLGAPTGKAAKRMRESTGHEASTVARLIGMGREMTGEDVTIDCEILIIDEASMVDVRMLDRVFECLVEGAAIMFVGDVDQLPSVGPGRVLGDLIESGAIATVRLTRIFRQAAQSAIVRNAHRINSGQFIEPRAAGERTDFYFIPCEDVEQIPQRIADMVQRHIPGKIGIPAHEVQVLSPMRRGASGTEAMNSLLQERLNPTPVAHVEKFGRRFGTGDRILQTVNNYELGVMNGESGQILQVDQEREVLVVQVDETIVEYPFDDLDQVDLSYAMTVHKSQGSQFPAIVMPMSTQHYTMLQRPIIYTGITRATRFCVVIGQQRALEMAIKNDRQEPRITSLLMRLARLGEGRG